MNIGFISTRLAGTDGVSLETAKIASILRSRGHQVFYCAGELDADAPPGMLVPEMHFEWPEARRIHDEAFGPAAPSDLRPRIKAMALRLQDAIAAYVRRFSINVLFIQNAVAIPMQIPLGVALTDYVQATGIRTIAHNHDLYWERPRFAQCAVQDILDRCFPPALPSVRHLAINSLAARELLARKGVQADLLPNIFDYAHPPAPPDSYVADLRTTIGLRPNDRVVLQPTRVVPRKNIELSIELVARLGDPRIKLVITHHAGDEGLDYLHRLGTLAKEREVDLLYVADRFAPTRGTAPSGSKVYALWDAYPLADLVSYPSTIEGFGNAFLEAVYFRRPILVNRYEVYAADLAAKGFDCIEVVNGALTDEAVAAVRSLLGDPGRAAATTEHNYAIAAQHYSYEAVAPLLERLMS